jgi:hypothetical protein
MSLKHVSHAEITRFAQDRVNLPKEKVDEFRAQAKRLRDRLETKTRITTPSRTETAGPSNKGKGHQRATSVHKTQQQAINAGRDIARTQQSELVIHRPYP